MKKFTYILFAAAAGLFALSSCVKETVEVGEPENDSYGVYFGALTEDSFELDPNEEAKLTFTVFREKTDGEITVPVVINATYESENGTESAREFFSNTDIVFEDGQAETTFDVEFPNAATCTEYTCTVECVDKDYVHIYSDKPTSIAFTVNRVKWNRLTGENGEQYGSWTDDIVASVYGMNNFTNDKVEVYERDDKPGYYRFKDAYGAHMLYYMYDEKYTEDKLLKDTTPGTYTYIDATQKDKVYMVWGTTGTILSSDGIIWLGSYCKDNGFTKGTAYGTISNGVIKFPAGGLVIGFAGSPYTYGGSGKTVIVLPGCKDNDYSLSVAAGQSAEGKLPVAIKIGADVAQAKYKVYEGTIASADASFKALEVSRDETASFVSETSIVNVELEKTGVYSIVVTALNAGKELVDYQIVKFSYVKAGDTVPVVLNAGIGSAARYVAQGYNTDNTVEVWCYGTDIEEAHISVVKKEYYLSDPETCIEGVAKSKPVSDKVLAAINGDGYAAPVSKLPPGTPYKLVIVASNGYETKTFVTDADETTTGDPLPVYEDYTDADIDEDLLPETSEGYFGKYNFYAVDHYGKLGIREYISKVTISDSVTPDGEVDGYGLKDEYVEISGIFDVLKKKVPTFDGTMTWDYYGGVIYTCGEPEGIGNYGDYYVYPWVSEATMGLYTPECDYCMYGGFVKDGYIAFLSGTSKANFNGLVAVAHTAQSYDNGYAPICWYTDLLLVDESKDDNGLAPAAGTTSAVTAKLHKVENFARELPQNCVETVKGHMRSVIDATNAQKEIRLVFAEPSVFGTPVAKEVSFTSSVTAGLSDIDSAASDEREFKIRAPKSVF